MSFSAIEAGSAASTSSAAAYQTYRAFFHESTKLGTSVQCVCKCTHGCHGNSLQNGCHGSTNNVAIRHFRASNVAILELMATTYLHKNGCHDHISPYKAVKKIRALLAVK